MRLKIEINSREHFSELGHTHHPFSVSSRWWSGTADVTSFELDELLGTKLRALFQRKKGRDLFDLWFAIDRKASSPERIVACFNRYMRESGVRVTRAVFEENLAKKLTDSVFRADMTPLLRPELSWDIDRAGDTVKKELIARLPGDPWRAPNS
jgi:predicted nucleotidyltransferase component of viral defense system